MTSLRYPQMKITSLRWKPPAASASRMLSSIGRPRMGTSVLGISSVRWRRRLPRPAPMMMAFMLTSTVKPRERAREIGAGESVLAHVELGEAGLVRVVEAQLVAVEIAAEHAHRVE